MVVPPVLPCAHSDSLRLVKVQTPKIHVNTVQLTSDRIIVASLPNSEELSYSIRFYRVLSNSFVWGSSAVDAYLYVVGVVYSH